MFKWIKFVCFSLLCLSVFPLITHAECGYQRQAELSRIASNVQFSYNYQFVDHYPQFMVTATNLTNDIYMVDNYGTVFSGKSEIMGTYKDGNTITFTFYSNDTNCHGEEISKSYVNLPEFNPRYNSEDCKLYPNFSLCQMWTTTSFSAEQFENQLSIYKKNNDIKYTPHKEKESIWKVILTFVFDNILRFVVFGVILLILVVMFVYNRKKNRR